MKRRFSRSVRRVAPLACVAFALAGCFDFELVGPRALPEPRFSVFVYVHHDSTSVYDFGAWLGPWTPSDSATPLRDLDITVNGDTIAASPLGTGVQWRKRISAPRNTPDTLRIGLPALDTQHAAVTLVVPVMHSDTPFDVALTAGQALHLQLSSLTAGPDLALDNVQWDLRLSDSACPSTGMEPLSFRGSGPYPTDLEVPWTMLSPIANVAKGACFNAFVGRHFTAAGYPIDVNQGVEIWWRLTITP